MREWGKCRALTACNETVEARLLCVAGAEQPSTQVAMQQSKRRMTLLDLARLSLHSNFPSCLICSWMP
jgi:hypothetical protein